MRTLGDGFLMPITQTRTAQTRHSVAPMLLAVALTAAMLMLPADGRAQAKPTTTTPPGQTKPTATSGQTSGQQTPPTTTPAPQQTQPAPQPQAPAKPAPQGSAKPPQGPGTNTAAASTAVPSVPTPADYIIGPDDVLAILFWREKDLSVDGVVVRPDGKITLPLVNDIQAAGLTTDQLREQVRQAANRFVTDPSVTIAVKQINSRKVFVTGSVNRPGPYPLNDALTVLQMLALAGGVTEFANDKEILIMRIESGQTRSYKFNYRDVRKGKNLQQNIVLRPGDTVVVP
jgi:polysaccharide biosynthesis/export protein